MVSFGARGDPARVQFEVADSDADQRLDALIRQRLPDHSRRLVQLLFADGLVLVNGRPARKGERLAVGASVEFQIPADDRAVANPELPLSVLAERPDLVAIDKPPGMACAPLSGEERHTLANALLARYPEMSEFGYSRREPGLVHRLDTGTSGLLLAARSAQAFTALTRALRSSQMTKQYLAITPPPERDADLIELGLTPDPKSSRKVRAVPQGDPSARPARTQYQVLARVGRHCLLQLTVGPAYRHQIRAHLAAIGCPLLGDSLYGGEPTAALAPGRHALHAAHLSWAGSEQLEPFSFSSGLPEDLERAFR
jgi:23S rRNA pseudouridine1911/1915/1917 synthase